MSRIPKVGASSVGSQISVISRGELMRIMESCSMENDNAAMESERKLYERKKLSQLSKARQEKWGETVEAKEKKKEQEKLIRFAEKEIERRKIDDDEEQFQAICKIQTVEKAVKQLHDGQDRVKALHSAMFLADVLQEREVQHEIKLERKNMEKQENIEWSNEINRQIAESEEKDRIEEDRKKIKAIQTGKMQQKQLRELKKQRVKQTKQNKLEGLRIRQQAMQDIENEKNNEVGIKIKNIKLAQDVMASNQRSKDLKQKLKQQALEEDFQIIE